MQPFLVLLLIQPMSVGDSVFGAADGAVIVGAVVSAAVVTAIVVAFVGTVKLRQNENNEFQTEITKQYHLVDIS